MTGFNADRFNRQLHPDETKWINDQEGAYAKQYGVTLQQARDELTTQANLQVQNGSSGTWNQRASDFLRQAHGMLPADGNSGPGYMFFATPEQKANVEMYAKHYPNGVGTNMPAGSAIANSMSREQANRDLYTKWTIGAAAGAATVAIGGPLAALTGTPIFSNGGILGSGALASANGTGAISAAIDAGSQYVQNGRIDPVGVAVTYVTGAAGAPGGLLRNVLANAFGGATTTGINNLLRGEDNSVVKAALISGALSGLGYGIGKFVENEVNALLKPGLASSSWASTDVWAGRGWNLLSENSTAVAIGTLAGGLGQEIAKPTAENHPQSNGKK